MISYKEIFDNVEATLRHQSNLAEIDFNSRFGEYKNYENRDLSEADYFNIIIEIVFYSGFRAETVSKKLGIINKHFPDFNIVATYDDKNITDIMKDPAMIKNNKKIRACVNNAKVFKNIIEKYGSFKSYLISFKPEESFENLMLFKEEIEYKFDYLGGITAYHFMTDIGLPVLKPDRVVSRIFKRIGLIESENQQLKTVIQGRKFSHETGHPIRYIDIIFVKYGQMGKDEYFGLDDGICLEKNPKCSICGIKEYCVYYTNKSR